MITSFKSASLSTQVLPENLEEAVKIRAELEYVSGHQWKAIDNDDNAAFRIWKLREIELQTRLNELKDERTKVQMVINRMEEIGANADVIRAYHLKEVSE
ncbi:hypothetical protein [Bacillus sp. OTU530]|uniref:hypothetical protein n=1 Tax=Bacillus sp. OTU530 TaxID=3043862 RepID=UPI00313CFD08